MLARPSRGLRSHHAGRSHYGLGDPPEYDTAEYDGAPDSVVVSRGI